MLALSKLSYTQQALSMGWKPFPSESDAKDLTNDVSNEDIYASLQDVSAQTAMYANVQDLYQESTEEDLFGYGDEKIYDSICYYQSPVTHTAHHVVAM
jgi:beta-glucanase (GH16 family)